MNICIKKSRCEILIGGDDIINDVITLGTCFSMFVYIRTRLGFRADWRESDSSVDGEPQGNWRWNSNFRDEVASSPSFSARPGELACKLTVTRCRSKQSVFCTFPKRLSGWLVSENNRTFLEPRQKMSYMLL